MIKSNNNTTFFILLHFGEAKKISDTDFIPSVSNF